MDPLSLHSVSLSGGLFRLRVGLDELEDMDGYIPQTTVTLAVEVVADGFIKNFVLDVVEMALKSVHESAFGLSHILLLACAAGDAINEVIALAGN